MSQPVGKRRKSRELAMQMLFQRDVGKQTPDEVQKSFWKAREESIDNDTRGFAEDLFRVAVAREEEIDALLEQHSAHWRIPRMPAVDRNLAAPRCRGAAGLSRNARAHRHQRIAGDCEALRRTGVARFPERDTRRDCKEQEVNADCECRRGDLRPPLCCCSSRSTESPLASPPGIVQASCLHCHPAGSR